jgi:hypothetical protein
MFYEIFITILIVLSSFNNQLFMPLSLPLAYLFSRKKESFIYNFKMCIIKFFPLADGTIVKLLMFILLNRDCVAKKFSVLALLKFH